MRLWIKVVPGASRDAVRGYVGDALKVTVRAPAEQGRANAAVVEVLAQAAGLPRASVRILSGHGSAKKWIELEGLDREELDRRLGL